MTIREFYNLKQRSEYIREITSAFHKQIAPIYGDQMEALQKIVKGRDRECEVLVDKTSRKVLGILVYKTAPSMEYIQYGARNALELKTLFVVNPAKNSGKGIGSELENRINEIAREKFDNLQVTVSEEKKNLCNFL